jgi:hypothetical protein
MRVPSVTRERRAGNPAAPGGSPLPLLPLGPDGVRRSPPRRTHPDARLEDNPRTRGCQPLAEPHPTGPRSPPHPRDYWRPIQSATRRPAAAAVLTRLMGPTPRVMQMDWRRRHRPASACERLRPPGAGKPRPSEARNGRDHPAGIFMPLCDCGALSGFGCAVRPLSDGAVAHHRVEPDPRGESRTGLPVGKPRASISMVAERVGFEPTEPFGSRALQARALGQTTQPLRTERGRVSPRPRRDYTTGVQRTASVTWRRRRLERSGSGSR